MRTRSNGVTVTDLNTGSRKEYNDLVGKTVSDMLAIVKPGVSTANLEVVVDGSAVSPSDFGTAEFEGGESVTVQSNKQAGARR